MVMFKEIDAGICWDPLEDSFGTLAIAVAWTFQRRLARLNKRPCRILERDRLWGVLSRVETISLGASSPALWCIRKAARSEG